ncbi:MAG: hypothetical protein IT318_04260 [Anaerolineales bacterium]|nr:hypothetical protein [Anaerolineales bacterium]
MTDPRFWSIEGVTGLVLVLSSVVCFPGLMMFVFRGGQRGGQPPTPTYYVWERSFIMAAVTLAVLGFVLLDGQLETTGGRLLARLGTTAYFFGGVLLVAAEALSLTFGYDKLYGVIVIYVVMAFLAQAAIGGALLQAGWLAAWIGWATILWNIAWLVALSLLSPRDIYFPVLHGVMPLLIGIALLWKGPSS